jgi:phosphoglycerate dehydrogenase-like enzyme
VFDLHRHQPQALYYKPSYERLAERISHAAPELDIVLIDAAEQLSHKGKPVTARQIHPDYFWIHSEMFGTPVFKEYFRLMREECHNIKWLHTINTGLDQGPYLELLRRGITITNNHSQAIAIAEYVMAHVLSWFQNLADYTDKQQQRVWKYRPFRELAGTHWVIIGFGYIGQQVAKRAKAFGVHVTAVRRGKDDANLADKVCRLENMGDAITQADVVVLACASNDSTRDLVDGDFLRQMKTDAVLVNVARGDLVVEKHLKQALDNGRPGYAILDVFREEPLPQDAWFWTHPKISLTPHCSNGGSGMRQRSDDLFIENLYRLWNGQLLLNVVTEQGIL